MEAVSLGSLIAIAGAFVTLGTAYLTFRKIQKDLKKEREVHEAKILQLAKEADAKLKAELIAKREVLVKEMENYIGEVKQDLENFKAAVDKELDHIKDKQAGEIRVLGDKIEDLRTELRTNFSQMIHMLTKMIDKD